MNYDEIFTFENLLAAHKRARNGRRKKQDVIEFELDLSLNLWTLHKSLKNRTYNVSGYRKFNIYEPKKREIQALSYYDRIVQHTLCDNFLYPELTKRFIYDNGACQKGKGTDFAINRLSEFLRYQYRVSGEHTYIIKADIHHYFASIDHGVLKNMLKEVIEDSDISELLIRIIDSFEPEVGKGLPMGNQTSQLFALFYLNPLDRYIKEKLRIKYYVRYMDDIIVVCGSREQAREILDKMRKFVSDELLLEFNKKTQIAPVKNGVDFLGFHFYLTENGKVIKKLRTQSKKKYKKRLKKMKKDYYEGVIDTKDIQKTFAGLNGHLQRGNTYFLRKNALKNFILVNRKE